MTDIILDSSSGLQIDSTGDFLQDDPENNYIFYLVASKPGDWKQFPLVGVGVWNYLQAVTSAAAIQQAIIKQLKADVFSNPLVDASQFPIIKVNSVVIRANV